MAKTLSLNDVAGYLRRAEKTSLLLGAGASKSAGIPLAGELMREIHEKYGHCLSGLSDKERTHYGTVMGALAPNERKQLLSPYLEQDNLHNNPSLSYTNWGHIALAHLLGRTNGHRHSSITRVLSCNFDALLERSLGLLGDHLPLYDFGISPTDHLTDLAEPAIFHLHGQGYGLRMLNSDDDTQEHKEKLRPLLRDSLHHHLMLVMGYSGEADTIFDIIKEDYNGHSTLIWLGYEQTMPEHLQTFFEGKKYAHYVGGCSFDETMFELTHTVSDNWPPALLVNPLQHAASLVQHIPPFPDLPKADVPPFDLLNRMTTRMQRAQQSWQAKYHDENAEINAFLSVTPVSLEEELPSGAEALSIRARRLTRTGFEKAQEALTLSNKEERERSLQEAKRFFERAVKLGGVGVFLTYAVWGVTLHQMARNTRDTGEKQTLLSQAAKKCEKAHELNPKHSQTLTVWANTLHDMARNTDNTDDKQSLLSQAAEKYEKAHGLDPKDSQTLTVWAGTLCNLAQNTHSTNDKQALLSQASEKCEKAHKLNPKESHTLIAWAGTLCNMAQNTHNTNEQQELLSQASEKCEKAHKLNPKDSQTLTVWADTLCNMALIARTTNDKQELLLQAAEKYEKVHDLNPKDSRTLELWAFTLRVMAQNTHSTNDKQALLSQASEKCEKAHKLNPKESETLRSWAAALHDMALNTHNTDEQQELLSQAAEKYEKAHELNPKESHTLTSWANTLHDIARNTHNTNDKQALLSKAAEKYEKAHKLNPKNSYTLGLWALTLCDMTRNAHSTNEQQKLLSQAAEKCEKAHELNPKESRTLTLWANTLYDMAQITLNTNEKQMLFLQAAKKWKKAHELNPKDNCTLIPWNATLNQLTSLSLTDEQRRDVARQRAALEVAQKACLPQQEEGEEKGPE